MSRFLVSYESEREGGFFMSKRQKLVFRASILVALSLGIAPVTSAMHIMEGVSPAILLCYVGRFMSPILSLWCIFNQEAIKG